MGRRLFGDVKAGCGLWTRLWAGVDSCSGGGGGPGLSRRPGCGWLCVTRRPSRSAPRPRRGSLRSGAGCSSRWCDRGRRRAGRSAAARGRSARGSGRSRPGGRAAGWRRGWSRSARRGRCRSVRRPAAGSPRPRWPGRRACDCGMTSAISSELSGLASSEAWAITRVSAPCSWRTLASIRSASSDRAPESAISIPASSTRWRRTVSRVARLGGSTATVRPHSKRSRRREARVESSLGIRSAERTSWLPDS